MDLIVDNTVGILLLDINNGFIVAFWYSTNEPRDTTTTYPIAFNIKPAINLELTYYSTTINAATIMCRDRTLTQVNIYKQFDGQGVMITAIGY